MNLPRSRAAIAVPCRHRINGWGLQRIDNGLTDARSSREGTSVNPFGRSHPLRGSSETCQVSQDTAEVQGSGGSPDRSLLCHRFLRRVAPLADEIPQRMEDRINGCAIVALDHTTDSAWRDRRRVRRPRVPGCPAHGPDASISLAFSPGHWFRSMGKRSAAGITRQRTSLRQRSLTRRQAPAGS